MFTDRNDAIEAATGYHLDWETQERVAITEQKRWTTRREAVARHIPSDKYYRIWWESGSTEMQPHDDLPFGAYEVMPVHVTVTSWRTVE